MVTAANLNNKIGTAKPCRSLFEFDKSGNYCQRSFSAMPATVLSATVSWISTTYINISKHETLVAYIIICANRCTNHAINASRKASIMTSTTATRHPD